MEPQDKIKRQHHRDRPVIEWDEDKFGGFRVLKNLKHFNSPGDWKSDPNDDSHFLPKYKPCTYRRLSYGTKQGRPYCKIHCLLFEEVVDHQTCVDCDQIKSSPNYTTFEEYLGNAYQSDMTSEEFSKAIKDKELKDLTDNLGDDPIVFTPMVSPIEDIEDVDTVFDAEQPQSKYVEKAGQEEPRKLTSWVPCKYRIKAQSDCSSCTKLACDCNECPLFGKILSKKDCKECQHREE